MEGARVEELLERMAQCIEKQGGDETAVKVKTGTVVTLVIAGVMLIAGWLGTVQMVQSRHSEDIGGLKANNAGIQGSLVRIEDAVKRLENIQLGKGRVGQ